MKKAVILSSILTTILVLTSCGDNKPVETISIEKESIAHLLEEYEDCQSSAKNAMDCKDFTAKAISKYFGVEDLMVEGKYIDYNDIYDFVSNSNAWKNMGEVDEQSVLDEAQKLANEGIPVIAINTDDEHKFTVLIVAGEQASSSKWEVKVPVCAAFFPKNGPEPFINKTLNYAWGSSDGIEIWARK